MSERELVHYELRDGVGVVTMDSPSNRNALSIGLRAQLISILNRAAESPKVRVIQLTHTGTVFCSGMDIRERSVEQGIRELAQILTLIAQAPKPVVVRIAGRARAGGLGLLAAADLALAVDVADFAFTEVRLGIVPAVISVPIMARVSPSAARELFLTGHVFDAARAKEIGLVDAVGQGIEQLDRRVDQAVSWLLQGAPAALASTKAILNSARGTDQWPHRFEELIAESIRGFSSDEGREGVLAFRDKRPAAWTLHKSR